MTIKALVNETLASCGDPAVAMLVGDSLDLTDPYSTARVAGDLLRLPVVTDPRAQLAALMRGVEPPARVWARTLDAEMVETLCLYMSAEITSLRDEALWIVSALDVEDISWREAVLEWRQRRDALESVFQIAATASLDGVADIRAAIQALDAWAQLRIATLPTIPEIDADERLSRTRVNTPDAWWARA